MVDVKGSATPVLQTDAQQLYVLVKMENHALQKMGELVYVSNKILIEIHVIIVQFDT